MPRCSSDTHGAAVLSGTQEKLRRIADEQEAQNDSRSKPINPDWQHLDSEFSDLLARLAAAHQTVISEKIGLQMEVGRLSGSTNGISSAIVPEEKKLDTTSGRQLTPQSIDDPNCGRRKSVASADSTEWGLVGTNATNNSTFVRRPFRRSPKRNSKLRSSKEGSSASLESKDSLLTLFEDILIENRSQVSHVSVRDSVHFTIEDPDTSSNCQTVWFSVSVKLLGMFGILVTFLEYVDGQPVDHFALHMMSAFVNIVFFLEALVRIIVYPNKAAFFKQIGASQGFLIIDILAAIPFWLPVALGYVDLDRNEGFHLEHFFIICVGPMIRLAKLLRYMPNVHLLFHCAFMLLEAVPCILYVMIIFMWLFASAILFFEPADNIHDLPHAMWLVLVTLTTVGYGDVTPVSIGGYAICAALTVFGSLYFALPVGVLGSIFTKVWQDRDRILLMRSTRARLKQWGYTAADIPELFSSFAGGEAEKGELDLFQFSEMIHAMKLGFDEKRINDLFEQMDLDHGGSIDAYEFIRILFPKTYHELYGHDDDEDDVFPATSEKSNDGNDTAEAPRSESKIWISENSELNHVELLNKV